MCAKSALVMSVDVKIETKFVYCFVVVYGLRNSIVTTSQAKEPVSLEDE